MYTTYHLSSAQEVNVDILEAIKVAFKSRPITITIEEDSNFELSQETKNMLDTRLNDYLKNPNDVQDFDALLDELERGQRDVSVEALDKIAQFFGMKADEIIHFEDAKTPTPVKVEDKTANEKVQLISQLDEEDKHAVYRIIDGMLTKNKFQTFFEQNIQTTK